MDFQKAPISEAPGDFPIPLEAPNLLQSQDAMKQLSPPLPLWKLKEMIP